MSEYACETECPHYDSRFSHCVFYLDFSCGFADRTSYEWNIERFCPYAKENLRGLE